MPGGSFSCCHTRHSWSPRPGPEVSTSIIGSISARVRWSGPSIPFAGQPRHSRTADITPRSRDQCGLAHAPSPLRHLHRIPPLSSACTAQWFRTARWPLPSKRTICQGWDGGPAQCMWQNPPATCDGASPPHPCTRHCECHTASYRPSPVSRRRLSPAQRPRAAPLQPPRRRGCQRKSAGSGGRTAARHWRT